MTVKEFLDVAWTDGICVIIRQDGCGQWIYAYEIGKNVQVGKYDCIRKDGKMQHSGKFFKPQKAVEVCRIDGHCKKLIIPKDVSKTPKEVLDLEIHMIRHSYIPFVEHPFEIECYPKGWIPTEPMLYHTETDEHQLTLFDTKGDNK